MVSGIRTKKINSYLETIYVIPMEQYECRRERPAETACWILMDNVEKTLLTLHNPSYAMVVDLMIPFDWAPGNEVSVSMIALNFLAAISQEKWQKPHIDNWPRFGAVPILILHLAEGPPIK